MMFFSHSESDVDRGTTCLWKAKFEKSEWKLGTARTSAEPCEDLPLTPNEDIEVLRDGSLFLKKHRVVNWNLMRD